MDSNTAFETAYRRDVESLRDEEAADGSSGEAVFRLTRQSSLLLALVLSLGLWAAIWAAVASLASAILG